MVDVASVVFVDGDADWREAVQWAGAFLTGFKSPQSRKGYRRDLDCWFTFCAAHGLHAFRGGRRTHLEIYLRELEGQRPPPGSGTLYRRISTLSSWYGWLEDENVIVGNPAGRVRRPQRHPGPQPWLNRNELTDLLAAAEALRDMQRAARHSSADSTVGYDQSERSFHKDPTFVLMAATAR